MRSGDRVDTLSPVTDTAGPRHHASPEELDDLQVLRAGLYGDRVRLCPLALGQDTAAAARGAGRVVVVDPEGVPVAALDPVDVNDDGRAEGELHWLSEAPSRPFEHLQLRRPVDLSDRPVRVVRSLRDLEEPLPPDTYVLVLASTSLDGPTAGTTLTRAAVRAAGAVPGTTVGVVPLPPDRPGGEAAVFATLGLDPATGPPPIDPVAAGEGGVVALLTGLSGSGKSTIARAVAVRLVEEGRTVTLLDGDRVRHHLSSGLGFSAADRDTNVRRIGWVAAEIAHHGGTAICSPIAPAERVRREVADFVAHRGGRFVLVHVATPLEECERRDRKGLYAAARRGEIPEFTGISAPYEVPADPDLRLDTTGRSVEECAAEVLDLIDHVRAPDSRA